jgi:hypothetical protein
MKMKLIRITMSLISALFVFALIACDLEAPQSVRIMSKPGLYLSLGSPFAGEKMSLSDYLSVDELEKQLGGEQGDIDILEWDDYTSEDGEKDVQAYRVRYPVADININLSQYVEDMDVASNLSGASGGWIPGTGSELEIPLPLDSMSFAHNVTNVKISVTLKFESGYTTPAADATGSDTVPDGVAVTFKGAVFGGTVNGTRSDPPSNTWSSSQIATFEPATDKVSIGVTVPAGSWFSPQLEFDWEEASISIVGEADGDKTKQTGDYELDFSDFGSFMGEGVSFKEITGYMYLKKPESGGDLDADAEVKLTWKKDTGNVDAKVEEITDEEIKNWEAGFTPPTDNKYQIALKELFTYPLTFHYELTLKEVTVKKADNKDGQINVAMVILLPMEFELSNSSENFSDYNKLDLEALQGMGDGGGGGDLFGRTGPESGEDDIFSNLDGIAIKFDNVKGIPEGLVFGVKYGTGTEDQKTLDFENETSISLSAEQIQYPFSPKFELLVKDGETLKILKDKEDIDFTIAVEAKTDLNYQVKF